jgi:galactonate dehydratase
MKAKIRDVRVLVQRGWRNYFFLKITTEDGIVGWSEFDESFGSPGVAAVIDQLSHRLIGQSAMHHEHIREDLRSVTRPGSGRRRRPGARRDRERAARRQGQDARRAVPRAARRQGPRQASGLLVALRLLPHAPTALSAGIVDADGVRQIAREVGEKGFTALKTNIFHYDENGSDQGLVAGLGHAARAGRNVERKRRGCASTSR